MQKTTVRDYTDEWHRAHGCNRFSETVRRTQATAVSGRPASMKNGCFIDASICLKLLSGCERLTDGSLCEEGCLEAWMLDPDTNEDACSGGTTAYRDAMPGRPDCQETASPGEQCRERSYTVRRPMWTADRA